MIVEHSSAFFIVKSVPVGWVWYTPLCFQSSLELDIITSRYQGIRTSLGPLHTNPQIIHVICLNIQCCPHTTRFCDVRLISNWKCKLYWWSSHINKKAHGYLTFITVTPIAVTWTKSQGCLILMSPRFSPDLVTLYIVIFGICERVSKNHRAGAYIICDNGE